jgi:hypothetical protein
VTTIISDRPRSTREKLEIFRACFAGGLSHLYGTYDPVTGRVWQVKRAVTEQVLMNHLQGKQPYGVYLLVRDRIRALAVDFDENDLLPPIDFITAAGHYGITACLERSKSKGYHAWVFFPPEGVLAARARLVVRHILAEIQQPHTEVFPKHDSLGNDGSCGYFINAPLFGRLVPQGRTVFLDPADPSKPHPDQWALLASVKRVSARLLDEIIEINDLAKKQPTSPPPPARNITGQTFGLPPCAQRMLANGVTKMQRSSFFRLAVRLKRAGLGQDYTIIVLRACAAKNKPSDGKRIITDQEILEQTASAYRNEYRGCGCEDEEIASYCHPSCPIYRAKTRSD